MQLYKSRTFGEFFSDTFAFLKENGKHFYKNYFIINGVPILLLMVMMFIFYQLYSRLIFIDFARSTNIDPIANYIDENLGVILIGGFIFTVLIILLSIINYAFTPIYFLLYEKHNGKNFTKNEILKTLKSKTGKILTYLFASMVISIPVLIAIMIICSILLITMIGIPLLLIVITWVSQFYFIAFIHYLQTDKGVFECFSYSLSLSFKKFWATNGSIALFYMIIQVVQGIVTLIPYSVLIVGILAGAESGTDYNSEETSFAMIGVVAITYMVAFFVNLIMITVLQMNQSVIYFSLREENENINTKSVIDEIGTL